MDGGISYALKKNMNPSAILSIVNNVEGQAQSFHRLINDG